MTGSFISPLCLSVFLFSLLFSLSNLSGGHAERVGSMENEKTGEKEINKNKKMECGCCVGPADVAGEDLGS